MTDRREHHTHYLTVGEFAACGTRNARQATADAKSVSCKRCKEWLRRQVGLFVLAKRAGIPVTIATRKDAHAAPR